MIIKIFFEMMTIFYHLTLVKTSDTVGQVFEIRSTVLS